MDCIFCEILAGKKVGHFIYEDEHHVAFLDKHPIDHGHALVIPREHHERMTDMTPEAVGRLFSTIPNIAKTLLRVTGAVAFNIAQNNGAEARQIVPHVHIHIIPRYKSKGAEWTKRTIATDDDLDTLAKKFHST